MGANVSIGSFGACEYYGLFVMEVESARVLRVAAERGLKVWVQEHSQEEVSVGKGKGKDQSRQSKGPGKTTEEGVLRDRKVVLFGSLEGAVSWVFGLMREWYGLQARLSQEALAVRVARAYLEEGVLVAEAPTGVGKTLTYLVGGLVAKSFVGGDVVGGPWGTGYDLRKGELDKWRAGAKVVKGMDGIPLVVATATKALQDQIWEKDIPKLVEMGALGRDKVVVLKGKSAYFCENKGRKALAMWEEAKEDARVAMAVELEPWHGWGEERVAQVVQWVEKGKWGGEFDKLEGVIPKVNGLEVKKGECGGKRCTYSSRCAYFKVRASLERMDLIVTNQSMVLADLKLRGLGEMRALPVSRYSVVFDEGHHLISKGLELGEGSVTGGLWKEFVSDFGEIMRTLRLSRDRGVGAGVKKGGKETVKWISGLWEASTGSGYGATELLSADLTDYGVKLKDFVWGVFEQQEEARAKGTYRYSFKGGVPASVLELLGEGSKLLKGVGGELEAIEVGSKKLLEALKVERETLRERRDDGSDNVGEAKKVGELLEEVLERIKALSFFRAKLEDVKLGRDELKRALDRWCVDDYVKWVSLPKVREGGVKRGKGAGKAGGKRVAKVKVGEDMFGDAVYGDKEVVEEAEVVDWRSGRGDWGVCVSPLRAANVLKPLVWDQCGMREVLTASGGVSARGAKGYLKGCVVVSATLKGTETFDVYSDAVGLLRQREVDGYKRTMAERVGTEVFMGSDRELIKSKVEVEYEEVAPLFEYGRSELVVHRLEADGSYPQREVFLREVERVLPELLVPLRGVDMVGGSGEWKGCRVDGLGQGVLVLSSSWEMLKKLEGVVRDGVGSTVRVGGRECGVDIWVQGSMSHKEILEGHEKSVKAGRFSILMGTSSLAEGLDLPRELCMHVILVVLPFGSGESPVEEALQEVLGSRYFEEKALQDTSVKLVQMTGRLIRTHEDWGRITMLDSRLVLKGYGAKLVKRLPRYQVRTQGTGGVAGWQGGKSKSVWAGKKDWKGPASGVSGVSGVGVGGEKWGLRDAEKVVEARMAVAPSGGKPVVAAPIVAPVAPPAPVGWLAELGGVVGAMKGAKGGVTKVEDGGYSAEVTGWEGELGVVRGEAVKQEYVGKRKPKL